MAYAHCDFAPTAVDPRFAPFAAALALIHATERRQLRIPSATGRDFTSNDYLGLRRDARLIAAGRRALQRYGTGSGGSRLLAGNSLLATAFERRIARDKGGEAALLFSSGFLLNATVIASLCDAQRLRRTVEVYSDRYIHASAHQGAISAGIRQRRFAHNDLDHLRKLLSTTQPGAMRLIVTETVFGMDGDVADVAQLTAIAEEFDALLYLDEAHATGIVGERGLGLGSIAAARGAVVMGTFSKALGGSGAYVVCPTIVRDYLVQFARGMLYSTAASPADMATAFTAWRLLPQLDDRRARTMRSAAVLRTALESMGFDTGHSQGQIIPVFFNDVDRTLEVARRLQSQGLQVAAIRPPTVPQGSARVRIAVRADHSDDDIAALIEGFRRL